MNRLLNLCVATLWVAGCASYPPPDAKAMDALVGKADKAYFVKKYGPPDRQTGVGEGVDLWEYRLTFQKPTGAASDKSLAFDRLRLTFSRGLLSTWSGAGVRD